MRRSIGFAGLLVGIALALPAAASADTFCVVSGPCDGGHTAADLTAALTLANANPGTDTVQLPAGPVLPGPLPNDTLGQPVHIVGAGSATVVSPNPVGASLTLTDPGSTVSDLTLQLGPPLGLGLNLIAGSADHIAITTLAAAPGETGVRFGQTLGGPCPAAPSLTDSTISLPIDAVTQTTAIFSACDAATAQNVDATAFTGISGGGTVRRSLFHAVHGASVQGGLIAFPTLTSAPATLLLEDSTFLLQSATMPAVGLAATPGPSFGGPQSGSLVAHHVDVLGDGSPGSVGASATAPLAGTSATTASISIANSVLRGFEKRFNRSGAVGGLGTFDAVANITASYSDFGTDTDAADTGPGSTTLGSGNTTADPLFRDPANGDYRLKGTSPLIDAGDPAGLAAGELSTDEAGLARIAGGRTDIGAFEYQGAPTSDSLTAAPNPANVGQTVTFTLQNPAAHETPIADYKWDLDGDGSFETDTGTTPSVTHAFAGAGNHPVAVEAIAADGGTLTKSVTETVVAPAAPAAPAALAVTAFSASPKVFAVGAGATAKSAAARKKKPPKGTTFRYTLSRAARVTIAITQKLTGHRKGSRCVKTGKGRRCTLTATVGTLTRPGANGANTLKFTGRIGRKALKPGTYTATIVAVDATGQRSAPRSVTFKVVKG